MLHHGPSHQSNYIKRPLRGWCTKSAMRANNRRVWWFFLNRIQLLMGGIGQQWLNFKFVYVSRKFRTNRTIVIFFTTWLWSLSLAIVWLLNTMHRRTHLSPLDASISGTRLGAVSEGRSFDSNSPCVRHWASQFIQFLVVSVSHPSCWVLVFVYLISQQTCKMSSSQENVRSLWHDEFVNCEDLLFFFALLKNNDYLYLIEFLEMIIRKQRKQV